MTKSKSAPPRPPERSRSFIAGAVAAVLVIGGSVVYAGGSAFKYAMDNRDPLMSFAKQVVSGKLNNSASGEKPDTVAHQKSFLRLYWNDGGQPQVFEVDITGQDEIAGTDKDRDEQTTGVLHGYRRAEAIVVAYASTSPTRPGFGTVTLRERVPRSEDDPKVATGIALVHDCLCKDKTVVHFGKVMGVAAALTDRPLPPKEVDDALSKIPAHEIRDVWGDPKVGQSTASNER